MDNWGVFQTIICIVSFLAVVIPLFVRTANVIQKNTIVINTLTEKLEDLTVSNNKDHEHFHKSINQLEKDLITCRRRKIIKKYIPFFNLYHNYNMKKMGWVKSPLEKTLANI